MGLHGTSSQTGTPKLILLTDDFLTHEQLLLIPTSIKFVNLRLRTRKTSQDTLLEGYRETADPGLMIGPTSRPLVSFSNGWWVRDCETGTVLNLTAAHPLRSANTNPPFNWSVRDEHNGPQTVDCPPLCSVNALSLNLRQQLNELISKSAPEYEIEQKKAALEQLQRNLRMLDYATIVSAGYGEFEMTDQMGVKHTLTEDWSLLRAKSDRIGRNVFPTQFIGTREFTGVGDLKVGMKCFMNGATSGLKEGVVWDEIIMHASEHDAPTKTWIIRDVELNHFGAAGDSGAPIGLEGGLAGGIYVSGGVGVFDGDAEETGVFAFSIIVSLKDTMKRIQDVTGRVLEIPTEYDLSRKADRDRYHLTKTGRKRVRH